MANLKKPHYAPRNPVARSPLMTKGGMHQNERPSARLKPAQVMQEHDDWREELEFERSLKDDLQNSTDEIAQNYFRQLICLKVDINTKPFYQ